VITADVSGLSSFYCLFDFP